MSSHPCCQYNTFLFKNDILAELAMENKSFSYSNENNSFSIKLI